MYFKNVNYNEKMKISTNTLAQSLYILATTKK